MSASFTSSSLPALSATDCRVRRAQQLIEFRLDLRIQELGPLLGMTDRHFRRLFRRETSLCPKIYQQRVRIQASIQRIENGSYCKLSDIAYDCGFFDQTHFIAAFRKWTGISPKEYAQRQFSP